MLINNPAFRPDKKDALKTLKQIDDAYQTLSDINLRSAYDAINHFFFIQKYAWQKNRLNEQDLDTLKHFWSKIHINNELEQTLNFDKFTEYDRFWYIPFYFEKYYKTIEKKEQNSIPSFDFIYRKKTKFIILAALLILLAIASFVLFIFVSEYSILLLIFSILALTSLYISAKPLITFSKAEKLLDSGYIVDKWIKVKTNLWGKARLQYFVAFSSNSNTFYQQVPANAFYALKIGNPVEIVYPICCPSWAMIPKTFVKFLANRNKPKG